MKKNFFCVVLALLLIGVLFLSCGQETEAAEKTLRVVWRQGSQTKELVDRCLDPFEEKTGITVETVFVTGSWAEYFTKVQTMVAGGDTFDLVGTAIEGFQLFSDIGLIQPIDTFVSENKDVTDELFADVPDALLAPLIMDGNLYGFPMGFNSVVMHLNTDRFAEAGVELPGANWTKEEFLAICEELTFEKDGVKHYALSVPTSNFYMEAWLQNNGTAFMTDDFTKSTINSPESIEIFQLWQDLVHKYGYAPIPEPNVNVRQQLVDGIIAMNSDGRSPIITYNNNNFNSVAIQYLPNFKQNRVHFGMDSVLVSAATEKYDMACQLALWMASDEFLRAFLTVSNIPARRSLAEELVPLPGYPANNEIFYKKVDVAVHSPVNYAQTEAITHEVFSKIVVEGADVKSTLDDAAKRMDAVLAE